MFTVDHSKGDGLEMVKPGEYEVVPVHYEQTTSQNGNQRVIVDYEIRSDVEQEGQGQKILYDNFTVTDNALWRFHQASKAARFPDGTTFNSYKEWADAFLHKPLRVAVGIREHNGKKYPMVKEFKPSEVAQVTPPKEMSASIDDLPF